MSEFRVRIFNWKLDFQLWKSEQPHQPKVNLNGPPHIYLFKDLMIPTTGSSRGSIFVLFGCSKPGDGFSRICFLDLWWPDKERLSSSAESWTQKWKINPRGKKIDRVKTVCKRQKKNRRGGHRPMQPRKKRSSAEKQVVDRKWHTKLKSRYWQHSMSSLLIDDRKEQTWSGDSCI